MGIESFAAVMEWVHRFLLMPFTVYGFTMTVLGIIEWALVARFLLYAAGKVLDTNE